MTQVEKSFFPSVADVSKYSVFFVKKKRGLYHVYPNRDPLPGQLLGSLAKVKNATQNATWVFLPTARFRRSAEKPYKWFCFGCSRRVAFANFLNDRHLQFQTGSRKPWIKSTIDRPELFLCGGAEQ